MPTERTIEIHLQSEDNYIDIINIENLTLSENLITSLEDTNSIEEYTKNAFDKLLNIEEDLNFQTKNNDENCTVKIKTSGPTSNISYLNRKHKIYEHSKPLSTITPSLK
ncbi:hypothetical protein RhiirA5_408006 [Rhizophagus irregularis]|uniref:Uncharacterized protein n=1 Tax=Rhizophagus irregularis TaxID=588596 RepID=A0A2I1FG02_9GLOM|nr:hypothetical protein RhiirA5_408006 [Rhizophagus irregularis]PKC64364.1 hypothetical protein RhiirA1_462518 [Rhizophagus irregularis]PKY33309.1 hypothetical protein RhiirB3_452094 [Rhizophagus irregularis]CAB4482282.1 unnamed protein product [Rhizophagus irregularis]CAB5175688.1 unnamed protein product [Rhizophagus irregularis]